MISGALLLIVVVIFVSSYRSHCSAKIGIRVENIRLGKMSSCQFSQNFILFFQRKIKMFLDKMFLITIMFVLFAGADKVEVNSLIKGLVPAYTNSEISSKKEITKPVNDY